MKLRLLFLLLVLTSLGHSRESNASQLSGTAINTTHPDTPLAAPVQFNFSSGGCQLTVSPPLTGSGGCLVKSFDKASGRIEIVSSGPPLIVWSGTIKGNLVSGTYAISVGNQSGTFYLAVLDSANEASSPAPTSTEPHRGGCVPTIESAIVGDIEGWSGETVFKLDNGQIWEQAEYDYTYFYEFHPDVTIYQTSGGCRMKVEGEDETILVRRIK